jgi:hypothetical protein
MAAEIANVGRLDSVDAKRTADADKAFKDQNKQEIMAVALEKDPAKKKAMQDALDAKKEKIYKQYKVRPTDGVSSDQGGGTSSAGWGQAEKVK